MLIEDLKMKYATIPFATNTRNHKRNILKNNIDDYFQHKFKELTGYSPQQFLMEQRLLASKKMLKESNYNCTEIAYRCGFCTSAQFSSLFKKRYGVTPLQLKKQHM